jgi:hypothetical protein
VHVNADDLPPIRRTEELDPTVFWRILDEATKMIAPIVLT